MGATTITGTGPGSAEGPLRGFDLDNIRKVFINQSGTLLPCIYIVGTAGAEKYVLRAIGDGEIKIDASDVPDYLGNKLVPGVNINFTISVGPNKTLTIDSTDQFVKVDAGDSTASYLATKLIAGAGITLTSSIGPNKTLTVASTAGGSSIGVEQIETLNGSPSTLPFTNVGGEFIWNSFIAGSPPKYPTTTSIWSPFGSGTSYISFTPAPDGTTPDKFSCSKNIRSLRFYTTFQTSIGTTSRWRTRLYVNGVNVSGQNWGSPPNGVVNMRVFNVLEYGGIAAGSLIHTTIEVNTLPASCQNNSSYFVVEYDI
jgi:hypothetical protein